MSLRCVSTEPNPDGQVSESEGRANYLRFKDQKPQCDNKIDRSVKLLGGGD